MSTSFYLADSRYMEDDEIALAESYNQSAFVCTQFGTRFDQLGYSLGVRMIDLYDLHPDTRLVNNNNSRIDTIGSLLVAIEDSKQVEDFSERHTTLIKGAMEWAKSRPPSLDWKVFLFLMALEAEENSAINLIEEPGASQYMNRVRR